MKKTIQTIDQFGYPAIRMDNDRYEAVIIPSCGGTLLSLRDLVSGLDILHTPDSREMWLSRQLHYGIPILFPPNRIAAGHFVFHDRHYRFPVNEPERHNFIHGYLYKENWQLNKAFYENDSLITEMEYRNVPGKIFYDYYPHEFSMTLTYRLSDEGLEQQMFTVNQSAATMPYGLGYHIAFQYPPKSSGKWRLHVYLDEEWELDHLKRPTGKQLPLGPELHELSHGGYYANNQPVSMHGTIRKVGSNSNRLAAAVITSESANYQVFYELSSGFRHLMLYNGGGNSGFMCIEPQTWMINAPNLNDLDDGCTGLAGIDPGETRTETTWIYTRHGYPKVKI